MKESNPQQSAAKGQNRQRAFCRNSASENPYKTNSARGICRRSGLSQHSMPSTPPSEPVIGKNTAIFTSNLQMLKEQAARLTNALHEIEAQIKAFEPR